MGVYENVPLIELEREFFKYQGCWPTVVIAGVAVRKDDRFLPSSVQVWVTDEQLPPELHREPELPHGLLMFTGTLAPEAGITDVMHMLRRETIRIGDMVLSFEHFKFSRAAFLGSHAYDHLYPEELYSHVQDWPKLLFEGTFENQQAIEAVYEEIKVQLQSADYRFHTLWDAARHLVGFRTGGGYFRSGLAGALRVPVFLKASVEQNELGYEIQIPEKLQQLARRLWYVARSEKGDRDEEVALNGGEVREGRLEFSGKQSVSPTDEVVEVVLALDGRRVTSQSTWSPRPAGAETVSEERVAPLRREGQVFIVHGRDHSIRDRIRAYLNDKWNLDTEVMELAPSQGRTLTEKFEDIAGRCRYAIIILSGDEGLWQLPFKRVRRARQNVVLELGFFWGRLERRNLAFLVHPRIELPSDISNVGYIRITKDLAETKLQLVEELKAAGVIRADTG